MKRVSALLILLIFPMLLVAEESAEIHWSYSGNSGPEHWADLKREFALCEFGVHQSPIDLADADEVKITDMEKFTGIVDLDVGTRARVMDLLDNGHTIQVTSNADIGMHIDGEQFQLLQFHFHSPSEHTIEGQRFPLEAHFVMGNKKSQLAVMGYVYEEGANNPDFDVIIAALPDHVGEDRHLEGLDFNIRDITPFSEAFYAYPGSLTTPPCSEGVRWFVAATPVELSAQQIDALTAVLHDNARPLQPRNVRPLIIVKPDN